MTAHHKRQVKQGGGLDRFHYILCLLECGASFNLLWGIPYKYSCKTKLKVISYRSTFYHTEELAYLELF